MIRTILSKSKSVYLFKQFARKSVVYSVMDQIERRKFVRSVSIAFGAVGLLVLVHLAFWMFSINKMPFAVVPHKSQGLLGILTSPLLHGDYEHLFLNSGPLLMFLTGILFFYPKVAGKAIVGIWLLTGIWVWILARHAPIIGASGVVYGLGAFLFFSGVFRRDIRSIVLSLIIAIVYQGMISGIFPSDKGISWESHLLGAIAGMVMAFYYRRVDVVPKKRYAWQDEPDEDPSDAHAVWNYQQEWPIDPTSDDQAQERQE